MVYLFSMSNFQTVSNHDSAPEEVLEIRRGVARRVSGSPVSHLRGSGGQRPQQETVGGWGCSNGKEGRKSSCQQGKTMAITRNLQTENVISNTWRGKRRGPMEFQP